MRRRLPFTSYLHALGPKKYGIIGGKKLTMWLRNQLMPRSDLDLLWEKEWNETLMGEFFLILWLLWKVKDKWVFEQKPTHA